MAVNLGFGPLIGMNAPAVGMPQPRRSWQARLYDRLNPNQDQGLFGGISDDEKKALTRQGLLQLGIGLLQNNNFPQALGQGLQGGLLAMNQGADDIQNRKYQNAMMQRTMAGAERNTQIEALRGELSNPDGSLNEAKFRQLAALDPESAKAYRDAIQPRTRYQTGQLTTPGGTLPYFYDPENPTGAFDLGGQPLYGGQPAQSAQPQGGLYDNVTAAVGPIGGRITSTTGGKHNVGSLHASGGAVDVGMGRESPEQQAAILAALQRDPSLKVVDERMRPQGQAVWGGPHLHVERAGGSDPFAGRPGFVPSKPKPMTRRLNPQEVAAAGYPQGAIVQVDEEGRENVTFKPETKDQPGGGKALPLGAVNKLTTDAGKLATLRDLQPRFNDAYAGAGVGGGLENLAGRIGGERIGIATPGQADWWQQYDRYKNAVRNELFGASLTVGEKQAFEAADITPNMDPKIIRNNLKKQDEVIEKALRRGGRVWAAQGYNRDAIMEAIGVPLDEADKPAQKPAAVQQGGLSPAEQKELDQLRARFGRK